MKYLLVLVLPALIIWAVAIPLFLFYLLHKNKKKMGSNENNFKFGMLTEEYKPKKYYWEFFKMTYKMLLQVILVKFEMNIVMKGILIGVILTIYLLF